MHSFVVLGLALTASAVVVEAFDFTSLYCHPNEYFVNWKKQFEAQNAEGVTATYTPEVVINTNAYGILNGPTDVQGFYQNVFAQGFNKAQITTSVSVPDVKCQWAMIVGKFVLSSSNNASVKTAGDFWKIIKKPTTVGGTWHTDIEHIVFTA